jgi:H+-transporting ATPase
LQDWIDFGIICALLLSNAIVAFAQEYQAGNIVASLKKTLALRALVLRNGFISEISSEEVVPGDIIYVKDVSSRRPGPQTLDLTFFSRAQLLRPMAG